MAIIEVEHVTKEFNLGQLHTLKRTFANAAKRLRGLEIEHHSPFKALDDVSFSIQQGEVVGFIGHNGAGKSTLLKLLSGITTPTSGKVRVVGKVAPLIEVGSGLVGDMTGRENIYLNAAILGMSKREVRNKFDDIVAFAELEAFIDTPVKRYSSGMQAKLGFAVATSIESEILIVDEVLAVGDLAFQKKCFDRVETLIKRERRTVLLVSHNLRQITRMCPRALHFAKGRLLQDGQSSDVCDGFFELCNQKILVQTESAARIEATDEITLLDVQVLDRFEQEVPAIRGEEGLIVRIRLRVNHPISAPLIVIGTQTSDLIYLSAADFRFPSNEVVGPCELTIDYLAKTFPVKKGAYSVRCSVYDTANRAVFVGEGLKFFAVDTQDNELNRPVNRLLALDDEVAISRINKECI